MSVLIGIYDAWVTEHISIKFHFLKEIHMERNMMWYFTVIICNFRHHFREYL